MPAGHQPRYLSTAQAAAVLGVSISSVKRWVDEGVLPAHKTAGGHRKLLRAEVLALARQAELPRGDLAALGLGSASGLAADLEGTAVALGRSLLAGRGDEASSLIRGVYASGAALEDLADRVIAPALARVGHEWETSRIDVWQEHRGTQLCAAALYDLKAELDARAEQDRPVAVGGAPEGDPYLLPTLLAQYVLIDAGWNAINLGPNTPLASLARAVQHLKPRVIWLSVSYLPNCRAFLEAYHDFFRLAEREGASVAVGGQALTEPIRRKMLFTTHGDRLGHLAAFARTLHPRPRPPRRGRPPAT